MGLEFAERSRPCSEMSMSISAVWSGMRWGSPINFFRTYDSSAKRHLQAHLEPILPEMQGIFS